MAQEGVRWQAVVSTVLKASYLWKTQLRILGTSAKIRRRGCLSYPALATGQENDASCCTNVRKVTKYSGSWKTALRSCVPHSEGWNEYYFPEMGNWIRMNSLPHIEFQMAVVTFHGRKGHYIPEGPIIPPPPHPHPSNHAPPSQGFMYRLLRN